MLCHSDSCPGRMWREGGCGFYPSLPLCPLTEHLLCARFRKGTERGWLASPFFRLLGQGTVMPLLRTCSKASPTAPPCDRRSLHDLGELGEMSPSTLSDAHAHATLHSWLPMCAFQSGHQFLSMAQASLLPPPVFSLIKPQDDDSQVRKHMRCKNIAWWLCDVHTPM